jgi:hypothetical protein
MKRFGLKTLNTLGYWGTSWGAGWLLGKVFSILFGKIWTEEVKETKPVLFWTTAILYYILLAAFSVFWTTMGPIGKLYDKINSKIDELAEEKEWD